MVESYKFLQEKVEANLLVHSAVISAWTAWMILAIAERDLRRIYDTRWMAMTVLYYTIYAFITIIYYYNI